MSPQGSKLSHINNMLCKNHHEHFLACGFLRSLISCGHHHTSFSRIHFLKSRHLHLTHSLLFYKSIISYYFLFFVMSHLAIMACYYKSIKYVNNHFLVHFWTTNNIIRFKPFNVSILNRKRYAAVHIIFKRQKKQ